MAISKKTAKKTAKKAAKATNKVKTVRANAIVKNGIRRPSKVGGKTTKVWDIADKMYAKNKAVTRADILAACAAAGCNPVMAASNYHVWRVFNGIPSAHAKKAPVAKKPAKKAAARKAPAPPAPPAPEAAAQSAA